MLSSCRPNFRSDRYSKAQRRRVRRDPLPAARQGRRRRTRCNRTRRPKLASLKGRPKTRAPECSKIRDATRPATTRLFRANDFSILPDMMMSPLLIVKRAASDCRRAQPMNVEAEDLSNMTIARSQNLKFTPARATCMTRPPEPCSELVATPPRTIEPSALVDGNAANKYSTRIASGR